MNAAVFAELSFRQSVLIELLKALFVGVLAAGIALWAKRSLTGQREKHQLRIDLVRRTSSVMRSFYFHIQAHRRTLGLFSSTPASDPAVIVEQAEKLKEKYQDWATQTGALEAELGAYFATDSPAVEQWHRMSDLLTVAYFALVYPDPDLAAASTPAARYIASPGLRTANALGRGDRTHSGLTADQLSDISTVITNFSDTSSQYGQTLLSTPFVVGWTKWGEA